MTIYFDQCSDSETQKILIEKIRSVAPDNKTKVVEEGIVSEIEIEEPYSTAELYSRKLELELMSKSSEDLR